MSDSKPLARRVGFEPTELLHSAVFKTAALVHSAICACGAYARIRTWITVDMCSDCIPLFQGALQTLPLSHISIYAGWGFAPHMTGHFGPFGTHIFEGVVAQHYEPPVSPLSVYIFRHLQISVFPECHQPLVCRSFPAVSS